MYNWNNLEITIVKLPKNLVLMKLKLIFTDIRAIFHGLGERKPRIDTVKEIQLVLLKQMALLICQSHKVANEHGSSRILIKHVLLVMQKYKYTFIRIVSYFCK